MSAPDTLSRSCSWSPVRMECAVAAAAAQEAAESALRPERLRIRQHASVQNLHVHFSPQHGSPTPSRQPRHAHSRSTAACASPSSMLQDAPPVPRIPKQSPHRRRNHQRSAYNDDRIKDAPDADRQADAQPQRRWAVMNSPSSSGLDHSPQPEQGKEPTAQVTELFAPEDEHKEEAEPDVLGVVARLEEETDRILAEQKRLDLERLRATLSTASITTPTPTPIPTRTNTIATASTNTNSPSPKSKWSLLGIPLSPSLSWRKRSKASPAMSPKTIHSAPTTSSKPRLPQQQWDISNDLIHDSSQSSSPGSKSLATPRRQLQFPSKSQKATRGRSREVKTVAVIPCAADQKFRVRRADGFLVIECYYEHE